MDPPVKGTIARVREDDNDNRLIQHPLMDS